jgi:UDP-N-acetylmuramoyl-L-alanyl-D-glutamate--2,6-diaminopimelate ligase
VTPTLGSLCAGLGARIEGDPATPVREIAYDSRAVAPGALFVALRGERTDGHGFAAEAARRGACALLVEARPEGVPAGLPLAFVPDTRAALADVGARFFGDPARGMTLLGVTGTSGKTSTVRLLESVLGAAGRRAGSLGTISLRWPGVEEPASLTTPESVDLQRALARMRRDGVDAVAMEVSSHSLAQGRVRGLRFASATYLNLSQDHLDYHGDMDRYAEAKALLFRADLLDGPAVLNARDPEAPRLASVARAAGRRVVHFARGAEAKADVRSVRERVELARAEIEVDCAGEPLSLAIPLPGDFQVENALAAAATAWALGLPGGRIAAGIAACPPVPGRLERVGDGRPLVLVDYAHKPAALDAVLARVRPFVRGRLIAVFGCGGDRDRSKRALMARAACRNADVVLATSDNPRTEDPEAILREVAAGLSGPHEILVDRRAAIARAIAMAADEDVVVIAGKGHEDYQIVGTRKSPFDDRVEAARALAARRRAS